MAQRTALITGASAGIGAAFAEVFAANGFDLVLTARREDRLSAVAARLRERHGRRVEVVPIDHGEPSAAERLCAELDARRITVDALVNNAGYGVPGLYANVPWATQQTMLQVMVVGVAELTRRLWPGMLERGYGRVINVASLAGLVPAPAGHTLYGATKAFLIKFSEALAQEGQPHGVHVTAVCPGFTRSEFHDVTGTREQMNKLPSWFWLDAETVARVGFDAVEAGVPVCVIGRLNRAIALAVRYVPGWIVNAVGRRMGRSYRKT
ncbi:MAG TPA: SDR family oxidoreductase [Candidatus Limnocylindria bacterium]|nr:SDR family oxidoreductase [Candidatus Limnocylindria bacterium]